MDTNRAAIGLADAIISDASGSGKGIDFCYNKLAATSKASEQLLQEIYIVLSVYGLALVTFSPGGNSFFSNLIFVVLDRILPRERVLKYPPYPVTIAGFLTIAIITGMVVNLTTPR